MLKELIREINTALNVGDIDYKTADRIMEVIGREIGKEFQIVRGRVVIFENRDGVGTTRDAFCSLL